MAPVVLAACWSGSASASTGSSGGKGGSHGFSHASGVAAAKKLEKAGERSLNKFQRPGPAFDAGKASGKSLFYIDYSSSPAVDTWAKTATTVLKSRGVKVTHINGDASTASFNQAIQEAIAQHANAIMLMGIDPSSVAQEVAKAKTAGIGVLVGSNEEVGIPSYPNVVASATINGVAVGKLLADWMIASSNGKVDADIVTHQGVLGTSEEVAGIQRELKRLCSACTSKVVNLPFTQINTEAQLTSTLITGDPELNFIVPVYDFELAAMEPSVAAAGAGTRVSLASFNALPNILQLMAKGGPIKADIGSPNVWFGYSIADQVMRVLAHVRPVKSEDNPLRLFVPGNIKQLDLSAESPAWYGNVNYKAGYAKLWKK
ncbi:MAG: sugar ABC transporter substrate-binding protein [Acidimicrobiales bacterium]